MTIKQRTTAALVAIAQCLKANADPEETLGAALVIKSRVDASVASLARAHGMTDAEVDMCLEGLQAGLSDWTDRVDDAPAENVPLGRS